MYKWKYWDLSGIDLEKYNYKKHSPHLIDDYGFNIESAYYQGVEAAYQYAYNVLTGSRPAGRGEVSAVERFIYDLNKRPDLFFDEDEANFTILVANCLRHPKGEISGQPYRLLGFNIFLLSQMFGWYYSDEARETLRGLRRFTKTITFMARGNAKTCLAAVASIVNMITNENGMPTAICAASVTKQARLAFDDISTMIRTAAPSIRKRFNILRNEIRCPNGGKIIIASSEASTLDGIRGSGLQLCDEIHAHPNSSVVDVLSTGMQSSKNPQMLMISTAGTDTQGFGREMFDYALNIAMNITTADRILSVVYAADPEDYDNWDNEEVWHKANPSINAAVSIEGLRSAYTEATRNLSARANFLTKHLDIWCDFDEDSFVDYSDLIQCKDKTLDIENYKGKDCYLGLDIAGVSDLSSLVYIFPSDSGGIDVFQKSYLPEVALKSLTSANYSRYYEAHKKGELIFTPSEVTDIEYIKLDIINAHDDFNILGCSIDAAAGGTMLSYDLLDNHNISAPSVKQGFGLSEPAVLFQNLVKSHNLKYNSDLLEWCVVNTLVQEGNSGDIRIIRNKADLSKKIDICVATIIGLSQAILKEKTTSIYETQNFRTL